MGTTPVASPTPIGRPHGTRAALIALLLACAAAALVAVFVAAAWPSDAGNGARWVNLASLSELEQGKPLHIREERLWLVRLEDDQVLALSRRSTHLGCSVPWRPDFVFEGRKGWFRDPCSGSTWAIDGSRVFGPAPRDLDRLPVELRGDDIFVDVNTLLCGDTGLAVRSSQRC